MLGQRPEPCPAMLYFFFLCTTFEWCTWAPESRGERETEKGTELAVCQNEGIQPRGLSRFARILHVCSILPVLRQVLMTA